MNHLIYSEEEVKNKTLEYFDGDELATDVWMTKYCMKNEKGEYLELTPDDTHDRMAKEFHKIEKKYYENINYDINDISDIGKKYIKLTKEQIKSYFKDFKYIVPQGSVMASLGNPYNFSSLSNCVVIPELYDSYGGILYADQQLVQLMKRRCGVGLDLSTLRPKDSSVNNSAGTSTGTVSFMERFSNTTREVAQCLHEDTLILTECGVKKIKHIYKGDKVWTRVGLVSVIDIYKNRKKLKKIITKYGNELICSEDHVIHTINGDKKVKELKCDDSVTIIGDHGWRNNKKIYSYNHKEELQHELTPTLIQDYILNIENYTDELYDVYDLSLEKEHFFFANGFYVHNSGRRGALMLTIDVQHVDIEDFITIKNDLTKVTGANISVKISDEFMMAVKNNEDFVLKYPINSDNPKITKIVNARELWNKIIKSARDTAEPGVIFWDKQHWYSPSSVYPEYKNVSTNPCVIGDTLLLTNKGWIKIKNLHKYENDIKIITRNEDGILYNSELMDIIITKNENLYRVNFENGDFLIINKEHKFYSENFDELSIDDMENKNVISGGGVIKIIDVVKLDENEDVYDITAYPNYNFFTILNQEEYMIENNMLVNDMEYNHYDIVNTANGQKFAYELEVGDDIL
jgi:ribonucleotide reductase alpha subunit